MWWQILRLWELCRWCLAFMGKILRAKNFVSSCRKRNFWCRAERPTTLKTRVVAGSQQMVRIDFEQKNYIQQSLVDEVLAKFEKVASECAGVILEDYNKGFLSAPLIEGVIEIAKKKQRASERRSEVFEFQKNWENIAHNHQKSRQCQKKRLLRKVAPLCYLHKSESFAKIGQKNSQAELPAQKAKNICRSDIATAAFANVNSLKNFARQITAGNAADQISDQQNKKSATDYRLYHFYLFACKSS